MDPLEYNRIFKPEPVLRETPTTKKVKKGWTSLISDLFEKTSEMPLLPPAMYPLMASKTVREKFPKNKHIMELIGTAYAPLLSSLSSISNEPERMNLGVKIKAANMYNHLEKIRKAQGETEYNREYAKLKMQAGPFVSAAIDEYKRDPKLRGGKDLIPQGSITETQKQMDSIPTFLESVAMHSAPWLPALSEDGRLTTLKEKQEEIAKYRDIDRIMPGEALMKAINPTMLEKETGIKPELLAGPAIAADIGAMMVGYPAGKKILSPKKIKRPLLHETEYIDKAFERKPLSDFTSEELVDKNKLYEDIKTDEGNIIRKKIETELTNRSNELVGRANKEEINKNILSSRDNDKLLDYMEEKTTGTLEGWKNYNRTIGRSPVDEVRAAKNVEQLDSLKDPELEPLKELRETEIKAQDQSEITYYHSGIPLNLKQLVTETPIYLKKGLAKLVKGIKGLSPFDKREVIHFDIADKLLDKQLLQGRLPGLRGLDKKLAQDRIRDIDYEVAAREEFKKSIKKSHVMEKAFDGELEISKTKLNDLTKDLKPKTLKDFQRLRRDADNFDWDWNKTEKEVRRYARKNGLNPDKTFKKFKDMHNVLADIYDSTREALPLDMQKKMQPANRNKPYILRVPMIDNSGRITTIDLADGRFYIGTEAEIMKITKKELAEIDDDVAVMGLNRDLTEKSLPDVYIHEDLKYKQKILDSARKKWKDFTGDPKEYFAERELLKKQFYRVYPGLKDKYWFKIYSNEKLSEIIKKKDPTFKGVKDLKQIKVMFSELSPKLSTKSLRNKFFKEFNNIAIDKRIRELQNNLSSGKWRTSKKKQSAIQNAISDLKNLKTISGKKQTLSNYLSGRDAFGKKLKNKKFTPITKAEINAMMGRLKGDAMSLLKREIQRKKTISLNEDTIRPETILSQEKARGNNVFFSGYMEDLKKDMSSHMEEVASTNKNNLIRSHGNELIKKITNDKVFAEDIKNFYNTVTGVQSNIPAIRDLNNAVRGFSGFLSFARIKTNVKSHIIQWLQSRLLRTWLDDWKVQKSSGKGLKSLENIKKGILDEDAELAQTIGQVMNYDYDFLMKDIGLENPRSTRTLLKQNEGTLEKGWKLIEKAYKKTDDMVTKPYVAGENFGRLTIMHAIKDYINPQLYNDAMRVMKDAKKSGRIDFKVIEQNHEIFDKIHQIQKTIMADYSRITKGTAFYDPTINLLLGQFRRPDFQYILNTIKQTNSLIDRIFYGKKNPSKLGHITAEDMMSSKHIPAAIGTDLIFGGVRAMKGVSMLYALAKVTGTVLFYGAGIMGGILGKEGKKKIQKFGKDLYMMENNVKTFLNANEVSGGFIKRKFVGLLNRGLIDSLTTVTNISSQVESRTEFGAIGLQILQSLIESSMANEFAGVKPKKVATLRQNLFPAFVNQIFSTLLLSRQFLDQQKGIRELTPLELEGRKHIDTVLSATGADGIGQLYGYSQVLPEQQISIAELAFSAVMGYKGAEFDVERNYKEIYQNERRGFEILKDTEVKRIADGMATRQHLGKKAILQYLKDEVKKVNEKREIKVSAKTVYNRYMGLTDTNFSFWQTLKSTSGPEREQFLKSSIRTKRIKFIMINEVLKRDKTGISRFKSLKRMLKKRKQWDPKMFSDRDKQIIGNVDPQLLG